MKQKYDLGNNVVKKRFVSYREAVELYSIGLTRLQEYAKKAGATGGTTINGRGLENGQIIKFFNIPIFILKKKKKEL